MLGYSPASLVGRDPYDFFHPEDAVAIRRSHDANLDHPDTTVVQYRFRRSDGSYVWLESTSRSIRDPDTGEVTELQCASRDVTHRRETESMLRLVQTAVEQVADAVVITEPTLDPPGPRIVYVNQAFLDMSGYSKHEILGQTPRLLQGPATDRETLDRLKRRLAEGKTFHGQTTNYRKDGRPYVLEWAVTPVRDTQGRLTNWVSIQRDVTEKLEAEAAERERSRELAHVGRLSTMGEMASGLAHELNQPLAAISNYAKGVLHRLDGDGMAVASDLRQAVEEVAAQADRAGRIIQHLRGFVRKHEARHTSVAVETMVDEVVTLMAHDLKAHHAKVVFEAEGDPPPVLVDQIQIEQVLLNLIRNAVEATAAASTGQRSGRCVVRVRCDCHDDQWVRVRVIDAGPGLSPEQLDHVFDPFFSTKDDGMGMGLTISRSLVELHGGRLTVDANAPEPGLTFTMTLPRSRA